MNVLLLAGGGFALLLGSTAAAAPLVSLAYHELALSAVRPTGWPLSEGVVPQPLTPRNGLYKGPVGPTPETLPFISYCCTTLRMVTLPVVS